jgi:hypothetical protein
MGSSWLRNACALFEIHCLLQPVAQFMHNTIVHEGQAPPFSDHATLACSTDSLGLGSRGGAWHFAAMWSSCGTGSCWMLHICAQHMQRHAEDSTSHSGRSMLAWSQPASRRGCSGICTRGGVCNAHARFRCVCGRLLARLLLLACMQTAQHRAQSRKHSDQCRHCACWYVCGCCCLCGGWLATLSRGVCHHDNHACWVIAGNQLICTATLPMFRSIHGRSGPHGSSGKAKAKNKTRHRFST